MEESDLTEVDFPTNLKDLQKLCRFCLKKPELEMRAIHPDLLADSQILEMFETITAIRIDVSYAILVCSICVDHMKLVCHIRDNFLRAAALCGKWEGQSRRSSQNQEEVEVETPNIEFKTELLSDDRDRSESETEDNKFNSLEQLIIQANVDREFKKEELESDHCQDVYVDCDYYPPSNTKDTEEGELVKRRRGRPRKTDVSVLICDICGAQLNNRQLLLRHMSTEHGSRKSRNTSKTTTCHICGKTNLKRMAQHLRDHRKENIFKCHYCPKSFNRKGMMLQHERQHTGERPFICDMCGFSFTSSAALKRHCKMHSLPASNSKTYAKVQHTNRLRAIRTEPIPKLPPHQGIRPECPLCRNTFVNRVSIQRHMKLQHGLEGMAAWKQMLDTTCMVCNEKFATNEELVQHKPVHIEHQCEICRRRFHSKITLDLHVKSHSKKARPYKCDLCEASYPCAFTLKIHFRRAHTDERPFKCTNCGHAFVERSVLNAHMRKVHSILGQLKPHKCTLCPETFKSRDALRSHTEKHTGQYRYLCRLCNRNMHSGPQLAEHERIYHPEVMLGATTQQQPKYSISAMVTTTSTS